MSESHQPRPEGVVQSTDTVPADPLRIHKLRIEGAKLLSDLTKDYAFFSLGLLYAVERDAPDVLAAFCQERNEEIPVFSITVDRILLDGLQSYSRVLWLVPLEYWPALKAWLGTVAIANNQRKQVWRLRPQELTLYDPMHRGLVTPEDAVTFNLTVFALESNNGNWYLRARGFLGAQAEFTTMAFPETVRFADAIFREESNPYEAQNENHDETGSRSGRGDQGGSGGGLAGGESTPGSSAVL